MAMGIVNNEEFEKELINLTVKVPESSVKIIDINRGRGEGNREVPESLKKVIGEESVLSGRGGALGLARAFGLSDSSVSAYSNGSDSTASYDKPNNNLTNHINNAKRRVAKSARQKLSLALSKITPEKLEDTKARDLAGIAKDMSAVIRNLEPSSVTGESHINSPQFIIYAPQTRREESFGEVIHVQE